MAATSMSISLSSPSLSSILNLKPRSPFTTHTSSLSIISPPPTLSSRRTIFFRNPPHEIPPRTSQIWRISAASANAPPSEAIPVENSQQIVAGGDDGVSTIISVLLFIAFLGLSILTIGVIYIAVTDFLQKRERERFEKEEAAKKKKKSGKRGKVRTRAGPRGFGQKIEDEDDD